MAYSAVSHPSPFPFFHPGTPSSIDAVQRTRVVPKAIRQDPSAYGATFRSRETGRISWSARPRRAGVESGVTELLDDRCGGLAGRQRNDNDIAAPGANFPGANDGCFSVIAALHENVGTKRLHHLERRVFVENDDRIDHRQCGNDVGALDLRANRTIRSLVESPGRV